MRGGDSRSRRARPLRESIVRDSALCFMPARVPGPAASAATGPFRCSVCVDGRGGVAVLVVAGLLQPVDRCSPLTRPTWQFDYRRQWAWGPWQAASSCPQTIFSCRTYSSHLPPALRTSRQAAFCTARSCLTLAVAGRSAVGDFNSARAARWRPAKPQHACSLQRLTEGQQPAGQVSLVGPVGHGAGVYPDRRDAVRRGGECSRRMHSNTRAGRSRSRPGRASCPHALQLGRVGSPPTKYISCGASKKKP